VTKRTTKTTSKRPSILTDAVVRQAAQAKARADAPVITDETDDTGDDPIIPTAISLRKSDWKLLRQVADARADAGEPGRRSASRVIAQLIDRHRHELEAEVRQA
jgi:hypothetical protein